MVAAGKKHATHPWTSLEDNGPFFVECDKKKKWKDRFYKRKGVISAKRWKAVKAVVADKGEDDAIMKALGLEGRLSIALATKAIDFFHLDLGNNMRTMMPAGPVEAVMAAAARALAELSEHGSGLNGKMEARVSFGRGTLGLTAQQKKHDLELFGETIGWNEKPIEPRRRIASSSSSGSDSDDSDEEDRASSSEEEDQDNSSDASVTKDTNKADLPQSHEGRVGKQPESCMFTRENIRGEQHMNVLIRAKQVCWTDMVCNRSMGRSLGYAGQRKNQHSGPSKRVLLAAFNADAQRTGAKGDDM